MKTNAGVTANTSCLLDVMPVMVRVPVVADNPGFMSIACEKLADVIADTAFIGNGVPSTVNSTVKGGVIIKGGVIMGGM